MATHSQYALNPQYFDSTWQRFAASSSQGEGEQAPYDVVIIGGGSVGAGAALDAATRGLKVAVVETRDFAAGTSSRSSKMFHGGLRYLAMFDFKLVAESLRERELNMAHLAPHLVRPLRFIFPLTHHVWERVMMFAGFTLYDLMGGAKTVPMQKHLSRRGVLKQAPGIAADAIVGGVRYYDTLVDDARHTMMVLRTAAEYGADVRTSTQVVDLHRTGQRVTHATLRDTNTGAQTTIHAHSFINCTGVWTSNVEKLAGTQGSFSVHMSKGVHIVVPKQCIDADAAMTFVTDTSVLFMIPWHEHWIIGTTDTSWELSKANPAPTAQDINYLLEQANKRLATPLQHSDIVGVYSGLRPLLRGSSETTSNLSRNHAVSHVLPGLVSVAGGKYTTYRVIGADAVDVAISDIPRAVAASVTAQTPIIGASGYHALANQVPQLAQRYQLSEAHIERLLGRYGSLLDEVLSPATEDARLLDTIPAAPNYLWAEVRYAVTHEGALHLEDVLHRRLRVGMEYAHRGLDCAAEVAEYIAPHLGWSAETTQQEVRQFREATQAQLEAEAELTDAAADLIVTQHNDVRGHIDAGVDTGVDAGAGAARAPKQADSNAKLGSTAEQNQDGVSMSKQYVAAIDQGTTSTRCIIYDAQAKPVAIGQFEHTQHFPQKGWVEHDPKEIWDNTRRAVAAALAEADIAKSDIAAVGITNQRETTVVWNKHTGEPVYNAIVWQDTRTTEICASLSGANGGRAQGSGAQVSRANAGGARDGMERYRERTGMLLNSYPSGPKIKWILDNVPEAREQAEAGDLLFGTIDTWLLWNLTGGAAGDNGHPAVHATDVTNASRTLLMDIHTLQWDADICADMGIPMSMLPEIKPSVSEFGQVRARGTLSGVPICAMLGDQQAAMFGQGCFHEGDAKNTYGTGLFLLLNTGTEAKISEHGLLTTVCFQLADQPAVYALEGSVAMGGALVQWLRDNLGMINKASDIEQLAAKVEDNGGVYIVPAFSGLFAPRWRSDARGVIVGLTRFANRHHIARAVLEATAYQTREVMEAMASDAEVPLSELRVDGGMTNNELLMQFQADVLGVPVVRPENVETTALGAAFAAGIGAGYWPDLQALEELITADDTWQPKMDDESVALLYDEWNKAVERTYGWEAR